MHEKQERRIWEELRKLRDRQHDFANVLTQASVNAGRCEKLEGTVNDHGEKVATLRVQVDTLLDIEKSRTAKLIAVVGAVCGVVSLIVQFAFKFWGK